MGELSSALDALADVDLTALTAGELLDRTAELVRARNRFDAEIARRCALPTAGRPASTTG